ncbi:MAG TPA: hypothetical protein VGI12_05470 [Vicinamibacterales bacterium]|jgi:hypothetical protein
MCGFVLALPRPASAQTEPVGVRAAGMGGAFTAVADDATGAYWNPAGLASGAFVGITFDLNTLDGHTAAFGGLSSPPFGVSYFRTVTTVEAATGRNGAVGNLPVHHGGVTLDQSIGDTGVAVGATLGVVHGNGATGIGADAGVMFSGSLVKVGLVVHNLAGPSLGDVRLLRQVRAGVSLHLHDAVTLAADLDLSKTPSVEGAWREAALGLEAHPVARGWLRGGLHWDTAGSLAAPIGTVGGSYGILGPVRLDGQASFGSSHGDRGWGVGIGVVY